MQDLVLPRIAPYDEDQFICMSYDISQITMFFVVYAALYCILDVRKYKKAFEITSLIISSLACWLFVYSLDYNLLLSYYWYDIVLMIYNRDITMIAHHWLVIYGLCHCPTYGDYQNVLMMILSAKISDLFVHQNKIISYLDLESGNRTTFKTAIKLWRLSSILITLILWALFRFLFIMSLFPFNTLEANILMPIFLLVNAMWVPKLIQNATTIIDEFIVPSH
jgi:hypothetical protein